MFLNVLCKFFGMGEFVDIEGEFVDWMNCDDYEKFIQDNKRVEQQQCRKCYV